MKNRRPHDHGFAETMVKKKCMVYRKLCDRHLTTTVHHVLPAHPGGIILPKKAFFFNNGQQLHSAS